MIMIDGYVVFCAWAAVKNHFNTNYNFFTYNGKMKGFSRQKFESRNDQSMFHLLGKKIPKKDLILFLVANYAHNPDQYVDQLLDESAVDKYRAFRKRQEALTYTFKSDISKLLERMTATDLLSVRKGQSPLINAYFANEISLETLIILDLLIDCFKHFDKEIDDDLLWPKLKFKCKKLLPFMKIDIINMRKVWLDINEKLC